MSRSGPSGQAGFTLTETLVATVVGLVAIGAMTSFHIAQMYGLRNQSGQVDLQSSARAITDLFAREVRSAGLGTNVACTGTVSTGLLVAKSSEIRIRADLDGNGALTGANEDVTYKLEFSDRRIIRIDHAAGRTDTLWSGASLDGSRIMYFDAAGSQLAPVSGELDATQLTQVRRVKLELVLTGRVVQPGNSLLQTAREAADTELRNRYFLNSSCGYR